MCSTLLLLLLILLLLLFTEPPTLEAQRGLILISKLLQNLSNGIVFDDSKEEYTAELNKFILTHMDSLHQFLSKLAVMF